MTPVVVGPSAIPWLDAEEIEHAPVLGMLSTLAHMDDPRCAEQALWTLEALTALPADADGRLGEILQAALTTAVRERMEDLMRTGKYEYQSDFAKKYFAQGREAGEVIGQARSLLVVLQSRGLAIDDDARGRIERETDASRLDTWIRRATTAATIADVFADD